MDDIRSAEHEASPGELFAHPQRYRDSILASLNPPLQDWTGRNYVVVFPTKFCPVGCAHCYFASPKPTSEDIPDTILSENDIRTVERFVADARTEFLQITGGGEPLLELNSVLHLVRHSRSGRIDINTSGVSLVSAAKAREVIEALFEAFRASSNHGVFNFRVSVDVFHLEQIKDKVLVTILTVFRHNFQRYARDRFFLKLHTLYRDEAVPRLLQQLAQEIHHIEYEDRYGYRVPVRVQLKDGAAFEIDYAARMLANSAPDMSRHEEIERAVARYDRIRVHVQNPGIYIDSEGRKGLCLVVHEDGAVEVWNTTPKDAVLNIRTHSFEQTRRSILSDVIQVAALEKTRLYVDALLDEINPHASRRAKAIGSATLFNSRAFSDAKDRLYVSIRAMQDYLGESLAARFNMQALHPLVRAALQLSKQELQALYERSRHDIVDEHLADPKVTADQLLQLHRSLALGHYDIPPQAMVERVNKSPMLADRVRAQFLSLVSS